MDAQERFAKQEAEVRANREALDCRLAELMQSHAGQFALMKNREIVEFFDTNAAAIKAGNMLFEDRIFSATKVTDEIVDLGIHSRI